MIFSASFATHHASTAVRSSKILVGFFFLRFCTPNTPLHLHHVQKKPTSLHRINQERKRFITKVPSKDEPECHYEVIFIIYGKLSRFRCLYFASSILTCVVVVVSNHFLQFLFAIQFCLISNLWSWHPGPSRSFSSF